MNRSLLLACLLSCALITACDRAPATSGTASDGSEHTTAPTNRIAIPANVRANLGLTFAKVERRRVEQTLRVPGRFEYLPTARREYRTSLPGRVELLVHQFDKVDTGTPLYRFNSPRWRELQQALSRAHTSQEQLRVRLKTFEPLLAAHARHEQSLEESVSVWVERVEQLQSIQETGGGRLEQLAQARSSLASARAELASVQEKRATLGAEQQQAVADRDAAAAQIDFLLESASAITSIDRQSLLIPSRDEPARPRWATIDKIVVVAAAPGTVESFGTTNGSWADERVTIVTVVQPEHLRFRASGLQSDLGVLRNGLDARIVPPAPTTSGSAVPMHDSMSGTLALGLQADPDDRTIDLFVIPEDVSSWALPGVSAQLEIVTDATTPPQLAIPLSAVQRDGLTPVVFRRAPDNPNEAIRLEADLGTEDGRWIEILSGVREGDEVVLDGAFQLMLATSGTIQKGGHFHADGTFHEGED